MISIDKKTEQLEEAIRDLRGKVEILEFRTFVRENSQSINGYLFTPLVDSPIPIIGNAPSVNPPCSFGERGLPKTGALPIGLNLIKRYKGTLLRAEVVENQRVKFNNVVYSVSGAAVAAIQSTGVNRPTEDGWRFWNYIDPVTGKENLLDKLRKSSDDI